MSITENLHAIQLKIEEIAQKYHRKAEEIQLIAVSKTHPASAVLEAYEAGHRDFGENKVQELCQKAKALAPDIRWHLIGHLQRNKVKQVLPFVFMIHSIDSEKLLQEIQKQAEKINKTVQILLQINISNERQKFGMTEKEAEKIIQNIENYPNVVIKGLMGMAEDTEDSTVILDQFKRLFQIKENLAQFKHNRLDLKELSMGMSGDYEEAIASGSTMIRIGSAIFGNRSYS